MGRPKFSFEKENELRKRLTERKEHQIRRLPRGQSPQEQVYQASRGLTRQKMRRGIAAFASRRISITRVKSRRRPILSYSISFSHLTSFRSITKIA